jgi:hypothetical protein
LLIDQSNLKWLSATGGVILLLFSYYQKLFLHKNIILIPPKNKDVMNFLANIKFFIQFQPIGEITKEVPTPIGSTLLEKWNILEITRIPDNLNEVTYRDWLDSTTNSTILRKIDLLCNDKIHHLPKIVSELCENVSSHSNSFGFIAAQNDKVNNRLNVTIGDLGQGIFGSLEKYYLNFHQSAIFESRHGPLWNQTKAIDIAFTEGVSDKFESFNEFKSGIGFPALLNIVRQTKGIITVRSSSNQSQRSKVSLGFYNDFWYTVKKEKLLPFRGTQVEIKI